MTAGGNRGALGDELTSVGPVRLRLYLLNGVRSAPRFMERLQETLAGELRALGFAVSAVVLFPYDDWSRRLLPQVREVRFDIMLPYRRYERSIGGSRALADLDADRSHAEAAAGERPVRELTVLVGHSAGGVAAVHAAGLLLAREGGPPIPVVMIGSPKCRIPEPLREAVLYVQAERSSGTAGVGRAKGSAGRTSDPVCRIGSFGGWAKGSGRLLPGWRSDRHAPSARAAVRIIGGHADYFRDRAPYEGEGGRTNMDETLAAVLPWLEARLAERLT
ncbi:hypothetical protein [Cohnella sp. 56]|uniref:hypothetical protein n=1 Tax=Cohnella sp. 56 TaxID=3113722 RepID=UPI0030E8B969